MKTTDRSTAGSLFARLLAGTAALCFGLVLATSAATTWADDPLPDTKPERDKQAKPAEPRKEAPAKPKNDPAEPNKEAPRKEEPKKEEPKKEELVKPVRHLADQRHPALTRIAPKSLDDLQTIERRVQEIYKKVMPAVVGVQVGRAQGSGVIVSKDGYVMTAGHVVGAPGRDVTFILPSGKRIKGKCLGIHRDVDGGLMKITDEGDWPYVELGASSDMKIGDWCVALGHPRGYQSGRPPVLRTGRLIRGGGTSLRTDCTLFSGDSGGPLFDIDGRVVGIHSRIGPDVSFNIHVPVDTYHDWWSRLAAGEAWSRDSNSPVLGINGRRHERGCVVERLFEDSAAAEADLKVGDVITKFNGKSFEGIEGLAALIHMQKPGDEVTLVVVRGEETLEKKIKLGRRG